MSKNLVVIPTFNEAQNIAPFLGELFQHFPLMHCLVVDDNSPDGTAQIVRRLQNEYSGLHLLLREKKEGLGRAYVAGFQWALDKNYECIIQMDADFSHRFADLAVLFDQSQAADFLVGTRWIRGGGVSNWSRFRQFISRTGNAYVRLLLGEQFHDWTGGFNLWHRHVLVKIPLESLEGLGYCFQVELKFWALRLKFTSKEVPIVFEERRFGQSKMSIRIIVEALVKVWQMRFQKSFPP